MVARLQRPRLQQEEQRQGYLGEDRGAPPVHEDLSIMSDLLIKYIKLFHYGFLLCEIWFHEVMPGYAQSRASGCSGCACGTFMKHSAKPLELPDTQDCTKCQKC